ncbi:MBL fold metallo-hydrolase [Streptomyces sp. NPDC055992]|uniref:MBL fold metallo-hydrolase n=1 Tax=Streptomyces sp. NPDC055992 TaxID=3345673 RepID=UPI0035D7E1A3
MSNERDVQHPQPPSRLFGRRSILRGAALGAATGLVSSSATTAGAAANGTLSAGSTSFRWLGTSGWRIDVDGRTVLFDPYITRFKTGLFCGEFKADTKLTSDPELIKDRIGHPEVVLVSHSHWDHISDVPHIAKSTGARIIGTETTFHLLVAFGVDPGQISVVKGGEILDFAGITIEVVSSRHSRNKNYSYFAPGTLHAPPAEPPATISDLPEGDTLAFQVTVGGSGPSAFLMGASDFSERALEGLRPDLAMIAVPATSATFRYAPRLLRALGEPGVVVPVHWDNFEKPLSEPPRHDPTMNLNDFVAQVQQASPTSRVVVPDYRTTYGSDMRRAAPTAARTHTQ